MEIDFSPLESSLNEILVGSIKVLGIPFIVALAIGFVLMALKVPIKIVILISSLLLVFGVFQMFPILDM